jgi:hypothetical protein
MSPRAPQTTHAQRIDAARSAVRCHTARVGLQDFPLDLQLSDLLVDAQLFAAATGLDYGRAARRARHQALWELAVVDTLLSPPLPP